MTIEEFIEARLAEDEGAARAADEDWHTDVVVGVDAEGTLGSAAYEHMVAHDPARALRQVAAMRAVVGRRAGEHRNDAGICETCRSYDYRRDYDPAPWPCPTARAIASIWSDHPDYQQEWSA
ncbi:hypothetical protein GV794_02050 [Nocardia cyriacigeorgica]|uniref:Uncharacterized protein n=1 Tax=Nocardia cyriacigeorgica TaxID=135487 RepID=A0ABX0CL35_9NOCA|nr:DUF6221 family protein [Nocardia cyriacigeorgica]NEW42743.1 hypothetical protein [Nocardia cyriacigeorgica]NEW53962.1 hypothetical protein [Nocardia cyriacigeorgica]NEW54449.1 hypothetical protein [Nocardia cyriacigeorgica]